MVVEFLFSAAFWWAWWDYARPALHDRYSSAMHLHRSNRLRRASGACFFGLLPLFMTTTVITNLLHLSLAASPGGMWPAGLSAVLLWAPLIASVGLLLAAGVVQTLDRHHARIESREIGILTPPAPWWTWAVVVTTLGLPVVAGIWISEVLWRVRGQEFNAQYRSLHSLQDSIALRDEVLGFIHHYLVTAGVVGLATVVLAIVLGLRQRRRRLAYFARSDRAVTASLEVLV